MVWARAAWDCRPDPGAACSTFLSSASRPSAERCGNSAWNRAWSSMSMASRSCQTVPIRHTSGPITTAPSQSSRAFPLMRPCCTRTSIWWWPTSRTFYRWCHPAITSTKPCCYVCGTSSAWPRWCRFTGLIATPPAWCCFQCSPPAEPRTAPCLPSVRSKRLTKPSHPGAAI